MKTIKKIKLSNQVEPVLKPEDMQELLGGACSCGCLGPSSTEDNKTANRSNDLTTPGYSACDSIFANWTITWT